MAIASPANKGLRLKVVVSEAIPGRDWGEVAVSVGGACAPVHLAMPTVYRIPSQQGIGTESGGCTSHAYGLSHPESTLRLQTVKR